MRMISAGCRDSFYCIRAARINGLIARLPAEFISARTGPCICMSHQAIDTGWYSELMGARSQACTSQHQLVTCICGCDANLQPCRRIGYCDRWVSVSSHTNSRFRTMVHGGRRGETHSVWSNSMAESCARFQSPPATSLEQRPASSWID